MKTPQPSFACKTVLGLGAASLDYLATVDTFPQPDAKIRTTEFAISGGGNAANTLTALQRLGVQTRLVAKLGDDLIGSSTLADLQAEGIDTRYVQVRRGMVSPFTYVIVDSQSTTRTCIHTPASEEVLAEEALGRDQGEVLLQGVDLLHLDSRSTLAAIALARRAKARGIPIVLDIEKPRPHAEALLPLADYIVTNATYPLQFGSSPGQPGAGRLFATNGMMAMLEAGPARWVISTQGKDGSVMVRNVHPTEAQRTAVNGVPVMVTHGTAPSSSDCLQCDPRYDMLQCPAWPLPVSERIVDTTGAGDAYIGGAIFGLLHGYAPEKLMALASFVAARKLTGWGARSALPTWRDLPEALLPTGAGSAATAPSQR